MHLQQQTFFSQSETLYAFNKCVEVIVINHDSAVGHMLCINKVSGSLPKGFQVEAAEEDLIRDPRESLPIKADGIG